MTTACLSSHIQTSTSPSEVLPSSRPSQRLVFIALQLRFILVYFPRHSVSSSSA
ncbi:hypothetical protein PISMIDRAFT_687053, partial [Pisolithus microcarpus 441]